MKNKKLKLADLKVKSFVTERSEEKVNTLKGGARSIGKSQIGCGPTPGTWCYVCPAEGTFVDRFIG